MTLGELPLNNGATLRAVGASHLSYQKGLKQQVSLHFTYEKTPTTPKASSRSVLGCSCSSQDFSERNSGRPSYGTPHPPLPKDALQSQQAASLLFKLSTTLLTRELLQPHQRVLVAVSGGQDSISLIYLLKKLQDVWSWKLGVAHCDHQWSSASRPQASHVAQIATNLGLDFYQAVAMRNVTGESVARTWRYNILHKIARTHGYSVIVTAHTGSDRVETLLHNLFRGSGLHGLQALTWKRWVTANSAGAEKSYDDAAHPVALVRPLLDFSRKDLRELCDAEKLPIWPDPSNFSMDIRRNRIRHQLLPYLRENFQASIDKSLLRWGEIVSGEDAFLEDLCQDIRKQAESVHIDERGRGKKLEIAKIRNLHVAIQRRVIKQYVEAFSSRSLGFDHVEHLRATCLVKPCKNGTHFSLPGKIELQFLGDSFLLHGNCRR